MSDIKPGRDNILAAIYAGALHLEDGDEQTAFHLLSEASRMMLMQYPGILNNSDAKTLKITVSGLGITVQHSIAIEAIQDSTFNVVAKVINDGWNTIIAKNLEEK